MQKFHKNDVALVERENERDENYISDNPQIDRARTKDNYRLVSSYGTYTEFINNRLRELHLDETTPHMHLNLMPITFNGRLCSKQLFDKPQLQKLQTDFYEEVGKKYGLHRGKEGSQRKHLSTAEFKAKKIIEQAEAIRHENQVYADALEDAKSGEDSRNKSKLKQQAIAAVAENADLKKRLKKSMGETLEYAKKAEALERQKDTDSHYARVGKTLAKSNPKEYERIVCGNPKTIGNFFDSVLSLFTPEVTKQIPRLQQIEAELEEERKKQEKQSKNNSYNGK